MAKKTQKTHKGTKKVLNYIGIKEEINNGKSKKWCCNKSTS